MSLTDIRAALETQLNTMSVTIDTAWENVRFNPTVGTPFQRVTLLPASSRTGAGGTTAPAFESGVFQVSIFYPHGAGPAAAMARAEAVKDRFARGTTMVSNSIKVRVRDVPSIGPALEEAQWYMLPVSVPYFAYVFA